MEAVKTTIKMEYPEIEEMIRWYKNQKGNENIEDDFTEEKTTIYYKNLKL
ncbi:hypothetical protein G9F71_026735 [Clostridium sp. FP2]|nr:hypothetical protein [Clostridium sp. FP2]MBZ9626403.1 hypothetical protein [Clostridium sp. FP2]